MANLSKSSFKPNYRKGRSLEYAVQPMETDRLLRKDIERRSSLPNKITEGSQLTDTVSLLYWTNSSAGTETKTIELPDEVETVPLVIVWYLGSIDKVGDVVNDDAAIVGGAVNTPVFSGANAGAKWNKNEITITVTSTNVGSANFKNAYFKYAVYYDDTSGDTNINTQGL